MASKKTIKTGMVLASAAAGLLTVAAMSTPGKALADGSDTVHCYGVNKCKGVGDCGGKGHGCAGKNECAGKGWIKLDKETCLKIKGGRLTPEAN